MTMELYSMYGGLSSELTTDHNIVLPVRTTPKRHNKVEMFQPRWRVPSVSVEELDYSCDITGRESLRVLLTTDRNYTHDSMKRLEA